MRGRLEYRMRSQWEAVTRPCKGLGAQLDALTTQTVIQGMWNLKSNRLSLTAGSLTGWVSMNNFLNVFKLQCPCL